MGILRSLDNRRTLSEFKMALFDWSMGLLIHELDVIYGKKSGYYITQMRHKILCLGFTCIKSWTEI